MTIEHVGSTSVPGLSAKPEIDILVITAVSTAVDEYILGMQGLGYVRGRDLSDGHHFFRRNIEGIRTHKVHVCHTGHAMINELRTFRDYLIANPPALAEYQALKLRLEAENTLGIGEYLDGKGPFIQKILAAVT